MLVEQEWNQKGLKVSIVEWKSLTTDQGCWQSTDLSLTMVFRK